MIARCVAIFAGRCKTLGRSPGWSRLRVDSPTLTMYQLILSFWTHHILYSDCFGDVTIAVTSNAWSLVWLPLSLGFIPHSGYLPLAYMAQYTTSQSNNNHFKNTPVVHFSAFVNLATETSAFTATLAAKTFPLLPLWRVLMKRFFEHF